MLSALQNKLAMPARVDTRQALIYLGYNGQEIDEGLTSRLESLAIRCENDLAAHCAWRVFPVAPQAQGDSDKDEEPAVKLDGCALELPGSSMQSYLSGAHSVLLFACTLGSKADRIISELQATAPLDALLYGQCANTLIENAAQSVQELIAKQAAEDGLFARMRFSPGYGDLPLSFQESLLNALEAQRKLGITTTPDHFMMPTKSISAVVGLFRKESDARDYSICSTCITRDYCTYHERGAVCYV